MKKHLLLATTVIMSLSFCFTSFAGWENHKDDDYSVTVYRDDATGQLITGWRELPWKDGTAWFYFGEDNILYKFRETPDGYIVDADGVYYDSNKDYDYNWSAFRKVMGENGNSYTSIESHFVSEFFTDFAGEMSLEEFKQYVENKGAEVLTCSQTSKSGKPYMLNGTIFNPIEYYTDFSFKYKGLKFRVYTQSFTNTIGSGADMGVID